MNDQSHLLTSLSYTLNDPRVPEEMRKASDTITRLTAEVEQNAIDLEEYRRDVERLRSVTVVQETLIREAEAENEKLRAALEEIIQDSFSVYAIQVARASLSGDKHE
jgi:two-component sensor histidine kinase